MRAMAALSMTEAVMWEWARFRFRRAGASKPQSKPSGDDWFSWRGTWAGG